MRIFIYLLSSIILTSCAGLPSYSFRGGEIPGSTFTVRSFELGKNLTQVNPDLPILLQDAIQQKFTNESNLKYTDGIADANFEGTINVYTITPVQGTGNETTNLNRLTISLSIEYSNDKDKSLKNKPKTITVSSYDDFDATDDFTTKEPELVESITEKLVSLVYNQVLVDW